jgi:hypothetical protein
VHSGHLNQYSSWRFFFPFSTLLTLKIKLHPCAHSTTFLTFHLKEKMFIFIFFTSWKRWEEKNHHQLFVFNYVDKKLENHKNWRLHFLQLKFGALVVLHIHIYWKLWIKTYSCWYKRTNSLIIQKNEAT